MLRKPIFWILFLIIVIIGILVFIFNPFNFSNNSSELSQKTRPDTPALVNGEKISKKAYEARLLSQQYYHGELYPKRSGKKPSQELINDLPRSTLENFIQEKLLTQYLSKKNITISDNEVLNFIQKEIIDSSWEGDKKKYEKDLRETYQTDITTIAQSVRNDLLIQKTMEIEKLDAFEFSEWYTNLRKNADVTIY